MPLTMLNDLFGIVRRFEEIEAYLATPEALADTAAYRDLLLEHHRLSPIVEAYRSYLAAEKAQKEAAELASDAALDPDLRELAAEEEKLKRAECEELTRELHRLLLPRDEDDDRNVIVEIRAGAGGEEAALFASDLFRMYRMYADSLGISCEVLYANETELGGFREISFRIVGKMAYARFKFESGVHRVQRVPVTESQGRIQTSTVTVAVLPEAEEVEVEISPADLSIESVKSSGAGGQHINKTESAVRILHIPSGIVVFCQNERSQLKNKETALRMLRTKLYEQKRSERDSRRAEDRKSQVGTGDRSEKIRTYNFPQGRITDHRIGLSLYNLEAFLNGNIGGMIDALTEADTAAKMKKDI